MKSDHKNKFEIKKAVYDVNSKLDGLQSLNLF